MVAYLTINLQDPFLSNSYYLYYSYVFKSIPTALSDMARLFRATLFCTVVVIAWTFTIITVSSQTGNLDAASTHYDVLPSVMSTGQERVLCMARGSCLYNVLTCPVECPKRKPKRNKVDKGCFIDCSSRCETTCKSTYFNYLLIDSIY